MNSDKQSFYPWICEEILIFLSLIKPIKSYFKSTGQVDYLYWCLQSLPGL